MDQFEEFGFLMNCADMGKVEFGNGFKEVVEAGVVVCGGVIIISKCFGPVEEDVVCGPKGEVGK